MRSVVVCASKKYKDEVKKFCGELGALGVCVFEPDIYEPIFEDEDVVETKVTESIFSGSNAKITQDVFTGLTLKHFDWIRKADVCYI